MSAQTLNLYNSVTVNRQDGNSIYTALITVPSTVRVVATTAITLSGIPTSVDSVTSLADSDLILVTGNINQLENVIWRIKSGAWEQVSRAYPVGTKIFITTGLVYGRTTFILDSSTDKVAGADPFKWVAPYIPVILTTLQAVVSVGKIGSGATYECDGIQDDVEINQAMVYAASFKMPAKLKIIGYNHDFQYDISQPIVILPKVNIDGYDAVLRVADNVQLDAVLITQNFYSEINVNYNSYSIIGNNTIMGLTIEGNSVKQIKRTYIYTTQSQFPATGVAGGLYVDSSADLGYFWNGTAYTTTGIAGGGNRWRAYSSNLMKIYAYNYVVRDVYLRDAVEFAYYGEQTNTDQNIFNDYETMEASLNRIRIVGFGMGGITWQGPHDSRWSDVKCHTNQYATSALYNIYVTQDSSSNGGGLVWDDVHAWGPLASYGTNVIAKNTNIYGNSYIEGAGQGLYATNSNLQMDIKITNSSAINIRLNNCYNTVLNIDGVYQFAPTATLVKLEGTAKNISIDVRTMDTNNVSATAKVFDITGLTSDQNVKLKARIPFNTNNANQISAGVVATDLSATSEIDIIKMISITACTTIFKSPQSFGAGGFSPVGGTLTGAAGTGYFGAIKQSSNPATPTDGFRLFADSNSRFTWIGQNGFTRVFDGLANTANRTYTLQDVDGTVALISNLTTKENTITVGTTTQYWRGDKSFQTLDKTAVGLSQVDNTSDVNKPVSTATTTALGLKENTSNKSTSKTLASANDTTYPSTLATKSYIDSLTWSAADQGFLAWTFDVALAAQTAAAFTSGTLYIAKVKLGSPATITNIFFNIATAGSGLTASQSFVGLYDKNRVLRGTSADQSGAFASAGNKTAVLTTPYVAVADYYYIGIYSVGTTPPALRCGNPNGAVESMNISAAFARFGTSTTGLTTALPDPALAPTTAQNPSWWFGLS